jgi:para-nitrobenzyl esterase
MSPSNDHLCARHRCSPPRSSQPRLILSRSFRVLNIGDDDLFVVSYIDRALSAIRSPSAAGSRLEDEEGRANVAIPERLSDARGAALVRRRGASLRALRARTGASISFVCAAARGRIHPNLISAAESRWGERSGSRVQPLVVFRLPRSHSDSPEERTMSPCRTNCANSVKFKTALARAILIAAMLGAGSSPALALETDGPIVVTQEGPVQGFVHKGVAEFLGIPYAAPPVGDLRWRPPASVQHWTDVLNATHYGNTCPQNWELGYFAGPPSTTEDCLYLNVFTTSLGEPGNKAPVIVWIHGGGNYDGESNDYDGSRLAGGGPFSPRTVVVTLNYRLGLLGFLSQTDLNSEGHPFGNYGILDTQAALQWVQRNVEAFGGDPNRVTLAGQSAGAVDTSANMLSPLSAGLFHRAIAQSFPANSANYWSLADATAVGNAFAQAAGCSSDIAACLRAMPIARVLALQGNGRGNGRYVTGAMIDGTIIPMAANEAWSSGQFNRVPVLGGTTRDEDAFFLGVYEYLSGAPLTKKQYINGIKNLFTSPPYPPGTAARLLHRYSVQELGSANRANDRLFTDDWTCTTRHVYQLMSQWVPVYAYEFVYQDAPYYFPAMRGFEPLAAHTIDIQFLFNDFHGSYLGQNSRPLNAQERVLSAEMVAAWTNFARSGNPNGSGNHPWPMYTSEHGAPAILLEDIPVSITTDAGFAEFHQCDYWNRIQGF